MYRFILFVKKVYVLLLFIILEVAALHFYVNSSSYTKAILLPISNEVVASFYSCTSGIEAYFNLQKENEVLTSEIIDLKNELERSRLSVQLSDTSVVEFDSVEYVYTSANIINNTISRQKNYITIDKGKRDGIEENMAIVSIDGFVVGYVVECSDSFSLGISLLNRDFKSSGQIGKSGWYGPIYWDGMSHENIVLSDIPRYAQINRGDTIYTTSFSSIYPPGIMIGSVESFELKESLLFDVKVKLFADMAAVRRVLLVKYNNLEERKALEEKYNNI